MIDDYILVNELLLEVVFAEALSRAFNIDQSDSTAEKGKTWIPDCLSTVRN